MAADSLGASSALISKAVEYSKERKQFGRVIGSFQAVKHMCAEMASDLEPCYALVWHAAHCFDNIPNESKLMACHAKSHVEVLAEFHVEVRVEFQDEFHVEARLVFAHFARLSYLFLVGPGQIGGTHSRR